LTLSSLDPTLSNDEIEQGFTGFSEIRILCILPIPVNILLQVLADAVSKSRECLHNIPLQPLLDHRQKSMTNPVPRMSQIAIGTILPKRKPVLTDIQFNFGTGRFQERPFQS
jgi:hypothetical protein